MSDGPALPPALLVRRSDPFAEALFYPPDLISIIPLFGSVQPSACVPFAERRHPPGGASAATPASLRDAWRKCAPPSVGSIPAHADSAPPGACGLHRPAPHRTANSIPSFPP